METEVKERMEIDNDKTNPLIYLFGKTWYYSKGNRKNLLVAWGMLIVSKSLELFLQPLIWAWIINIIQTQGITYTTIDRLLWLLAATLGLEPIIWAFHGPARLKEQVNAFKVRLNYRKYLLKGVMTLPIEWHAEHHSGDTIDKIEKGTASLYSFSEDSFEPIYSIVELIISYAMLAYLSHSAAYIVLLMVFVSGYMTICFDRVLIVKYKQLSRAENKISESVFDAISNITTVIILRVEKLIFNAISHKVEEPFELQKRSNLLNEIKWFLTSICCATMVVFVLGFYFHRIVSSGQSVMIGSVYLIIQYLGRISNLFFRFNNMYGDFVKHKARILNAEELSKDFRVENFTNHVLPKSWQRLEIQDLNFSYHHENKDNLNLEEISLSLVRGQHYAVIGRSGDGKSTFLKIMRDLYHPESLKLTADGRHVADGFGGISRTIALVPQDPEIFATTILENITMGAEYDLEFVRHFTDMACFTNVIENLPNKFNSSIKEKGVNLSGGEQQRLALARGLLACHDKDIVLLDEPTSSLDTATEMKIYRNIFHEFRHKTIISSVHRLYLLPLFNKIFMFNDGKIIASGSLDELLMECPEFQELWRQYHAQKQETAE